MYIYNETINIDESAHNEWIIWIESHIAEVLNTGKFTSAKLTEVLVEEEMRGSTYSIQYTALTRADLDSYYQFDAPNFRAKALKKFADKMLSFSTELRVVNKFHATNNKKNTL